MANYKDYYQTLGVAKDASKEDIRRAFRKLAAKHHPDRNPDDSSAEERFKEINEAYTVLSDPEKRRRYDMYGENGASTNGAPVDVFDLFSQVFGGMGGPFGGFATGPERGSDLHYEISIDLKGVLEGVEAEVEVARQTECEVCGGTGAAAGSAPTTCPRACVSRPRGSWAPT